MGASIIQPKELMKGASGQGNAKFLGQLVKLIFKLIPHEYWSNIGYKKRKQKIVTRSKKSDRDLWISGSTHTQMMEITEPKRTKSLVTEKARFQNLVH